MRQLLSKHPVKALNTVMDWLLPPLCPATGEDVDVHGAVSPEYWASLRFIRPPRCGQCAMPFPHDMGAGGHDLICAACLENPPSFRFGRAVMVYDESSRKLILRFKHGDQLHAVRTLVPWMREAGNDILQSCDVIMPVPLHRWRLLSRRYNQSALLARGLGRAAGKTVQLDNLSRVRATPPQGYKKRADRQDNVKGAFRVKNPSAVVGKAVVLIDDVMTTGATLNACADALLAAGAASVDVLCIARAVKE